MAEVNRQEKIDLEEEPGTGLKRQLIGCGLLYWIPVALFIWITSVLGDCFKSEEVCEAGRREGIIKLTLLFGGLFVVLMFVRLRLRRPR
jgi:hypothetical protein